MAYARIVGVNYGLFFTFRACSLRGKLSGCILFVLYVTAATLAFTFI